MDSIHTTFRVSYSDTDQMGFMHHSNYLKYYETARWELFRSIGIPYSELEKDGIILPVITASLKYLKPAFYDQTVIIITTLKPNRGARIIFDYKMTDETGVTINEATIAVACVKKSSGKPCLPPKKIIDVLNNTDR